MKASVLLCMAPLAALGLCPVKRCAAQEVVLDYQATALTVVGTPFGIAVPRLTVVTGSFTYVAGGAPDTTPAADRGKYLFTSGCAFSASFLGHTVTGTAGPQLQVENIASGGGTIDTFRFWDGINNTASSAEMLFDGIAATDIGLGLAITDSSGAAFADDSLPAVFPMAMPSGGSGGYPHTFSLKNNDGTMLLQFDWLVQRTPLKITDIGFVDDAFSLVFQSQTGRAYDIEFSTDLADWEVIEAGLVATGPSTQFTDTTVLTRLGEWPPDAFYRVRAAD